MGGATDSTGLRARFSPRPTSSRAPEADRRRGVAVAVARLVVATILLGATMVLSGGDPSGPSSRIALVLVTAAYVGTIVAAIALERGVAPGTVAACQIALDLALTSGLVYVTDGAHSGFSSLYAVVVLGAALALGSRAALVTTGVSLTLYLALGLAAASGWIGVPDDRLAVSYVHSPSDLALSVLRTTVGLLVVGGLAATLADRLVSARGEAERATVRAAGYAQLADDIVRSMSAGLVTTDDAGTIESANAIAAEILGRTQGDLLGVDVTTLLPVAARTPPATAQRGEAEIARPDRPPAWIGYTHTALRGPDGAAHGALVVFADLSELRELRQKADRAERLAVLGHLAAGLAHEIRNPLGSISGSVQLVREATELPDEDRRLLDIVLTETARLDQLVGTMLQIGRPSVPERVDVDLFALARDVTLALRTDEALVGAKEVALEMEGEGPAMALADPSQLRQLAWNLLKNAVQASPRGGRVSVRARSGPEGAVLEVEDRGPGIARADRERLFDAFFSRRAQGVGLGLALCRSIVESHGGRIEVDGEVGVGTTFRVHLPVRASTPSA